MVLALLGACSKTTPPARAFQVNSRSDLIGGKRALAEVGDYKLSNGLIHAIIQDVGSSRGFGAFGGSLIDVDLVRSNPVDPVTGTNGNDYFTEMFPAFFLTAVEPSKVEVLKDGADGAAAVVRVTGRGNVFLSMVKPITDLVNPQQPLDYTVDYILEPGKRYLKMEVTLTNNTTVDTGYNLPMPLGAVTLLGEGQSLFIPGPAGFDIRYYLEEVAYKKQGAGLDALPGVVTDMWATAGDGVSYAFVAARPSDGAYVQGKPFYGATTPESMLLPIAYSSFLGAFWAKAPAQLPAGGSYKYAGYLAVGAGDVASVQKVAYELRDTQIRSNGREIVLHDKTPYGTVSGTVREAGTLRPMDGVSVVLQDDQGAYVSQAQTLGGGRWTAPVPPGRYVAYAVDSVRSVAKSADFVEVAEGGEARIDLQLEQPGQLEVVVRDQDGRALPAKISVEGVYANPVKGELPRHVLYNLKVGERYRQSDLVDDDPADPQTRRYLEKFYFAPTGAGGRFLRAGHYTVYASRGIEYDLASQEVDIAPGRTASIGLTLHHVLPTPGWVSGDFHVHSVKSVDSNMALGDRVASYAVEGVDFLSSTDHNYVVDYQPTIEALKLGDWVKSAVGLELTSLEMGHFNAFPLVVQPGPVTHGSFEWFHRPPGELFAQLRGLGADPQKVVVQVNHPRDTVMGYFNAFNVGTYVGLPIPPTSAFVLDTSPYVGPDGKTHLSPYDPANFSLEFEAFEVFNGKRMDVMFNYRRPAVPPDGPEPNLPACPPGGPVDTDCLPAVGEVLERVVKLPGQPVRYQLNPAFPGAMEDWFQLLAQGKHVTATGNSDSHSATAEAGLPRTYLEVGGWGDGSMRGLKDDAVFDALREGRAYVTNGPIVELTVNGQGPGRTVVQPNGDIDLHLKVSAAPWIDVKRVLVRRGGKDQGKTPLLLDTIDVPAGTDPTRLEVTRHYSGLPDDSFVLVEVVGDRQMWPVFTPHEVTSVQISDAVGVIGGSFGFSSKFGKYQPSQLQTVHPYAFTNPVYVTHTNKQGLTAPKKVLPLSSNEPFAPRTVPDLRRLFGSLHSDMGD